MFPHIKSTVLSVVIKSKEATRKAGAKMMLLKGMRNAFHNRELFFTLRIRKLPSVVP